MKVSAAQVRRLRLRSQRLLPADGDAPATPGEIARAVCGLQAQESPAAALAIRARGSHITLAAVERARVMERTLVRTWLMRGTLHLIAGEDLPGWLALFGPLNARRDERRRRELGLDGERCRLGLDLLHNALAARGPLTRAELTAELAAGGLSLTGQALPHLLGLAAFQGLICLGPDRGAKTTAVLLDDWLDLAPAHPREASLADLAVRYLAAYGPATRDDLAAWSGLPAPDVSAAWSAVASKLIELDLDGQPLWCLEEQAAEIERVPAACSSVRLLPRFDAYLLGYRGRGLAVVDEYVHRVHPGGIVHQTLLVDGLVKGTWARTVARGRLSVSVRPFEPLSAQIAHGVAAEAAGLGEFFGLPVDFNVEEP